MSSPPPAPPQFSEDGKWWWTGAGWVPAEQAPKPPSPPQVAVPASPKSSESRSLENTELRRLVTSYRGGEVRLDGRDIVITRRGKEHRVPLVDAQITESHDRRGRAYWGIVSPYWSAAGQGNYPISQPDDEEGLRWLLEYQPKADLQQAARDISDGRKVERMVPPTGVQVRVVIEDGYLRVGIDQVSIPMHMVEFAGTEGGSVPGGTWSAYVTLYGQGTKLGQVGSSSSDAAKRTADWINRLLQVSGEHRQQIIRVAQETRAPLVKCLYCGARVQDAGRCVHCGAPLPAP